MSNRTWFVFGLIAVVFAACEKLLPSAPEENEVLDGPIEGLTADEHAAFIRGDIAFNDEIFTVDNGLGPLFVATSCGSCHAGDGKGHPFSTLTRFGQSDTFGNQFLDQGAPQLQNHAIPGYMPEQIPSLATSAKFTPPANTGLGYLDLVSDADLLAMADPFDNNGDGITGVPNWKTVPGYVQLRNGAVQQNGKYIHRFGKKAGAYDLLQQTVNAYNQDIGITSVYEPVDTYSGFAIAPEVSENVVKDVVDYLIMLKAPQPRDKENADVQAGKQVFMNIQCGACHVPALKTGYSPVAALSYKEFYPYTDLLLHDMGAGLDDGYTEGSALTNEWRTPPLWGLGLSKNSQGGEYYLLHDGRARSIGEAILMHGGEAENSRNLFQSLSEVEKNKLVKFLESL